MKKFLFMLLAVLTATLGAYAQNRTVTGVVTSAEDGEPLVGATVTPIGGGLATATDIDGAFRLQVPASVKKLSVTYVGMQSKEVNIDFNAPMHIELTTNQTALDEVMVVAFGTSKKQAFTGAATVVKADELAKHTTSNVSNALAGSVPGLQLRGQSGAPGSGNAGIKIRGIASLYASTDPLIIVDGAPYSASLTNINPEDIESVSVLKDAASAALYGARGAGGVIIITTKRGNSGDAKVSFEGKWGTNSRAIQEYDVIESPAEYYEAYYNKLFNFAQNVNGLDLNAANVWANANMISQLQYQAYTIPRGQMLVGTNGKLNPHATLGYSYMANNGTEYYITPDDWKDLAYRTGFRQEYNMSVTGGTDKASYYASINYLNDEGYIQYSGYDRISARAKADYQANRWLKVGANASFIHSKTETNANMGTSANSTNLMYYTSGIAPIYPAFVRVMKDGKPVIATDSRGHQAYDYGVSGQNYNGLTRPFLSTGNPLGSNRYNEVFTWGNQFNGTFTADLTFTDYLKGNITSNVVLGQTTNSDYENPFYGPKVGVNGEIFKSQSTSICTNNVQTLTFVKTFGDHYVNVLAGHEYYRTNTKYLSATAQGGFSPDITEINGFANKTTSSSYSSNYNVEGFFGSAQYNYKEKYYASASYRRDASSRFAKENRWGNFWSLGASWIINKDFLQEVDNIDMLKLKFSVGQQGNDNIGDYAYIDLYELVRSSDTLMSSTFMRVGNPDITWETTTNMNLGVEFGFFKNRLTGSVDFYNKKTTDLLFWLSIPESAGSRGYYGNVGDIRNSGVELAFNVNLIRSRDINWDFNFNITHNATKVLKLPKSKTAKYGGFVDGSLWYAEGEPLYNGMYYAYAGTNEKGEALYWRDPNFLEKDENGNPIPDSPNISEPCPNRTETTTNIGLANMYTVGSILPKAYGGFGTNFTWKSIDLSLTFDYQLGGKVYDSRYAGLMNPGENASSAGSNYHRDWVKSWTPENPTQEYPRWQFGDKFTTAKSDRFLTSASYLNFQSFTVGYTLPKNIIKPFSKVRVYASGENLGFISARRGLDPRYSYTGNASMSVYSPARIISGGIQVSF